MHKNERKAWRWLVHRGLWQAVDGVTFMHIVYAEPGLAPWAVSNLWKRGPRLFFVVVQALVEGGA